VSKVIADENQELCGGPHRRGRHQGKGTNMPDGMGNWILGTNEFREWENSEGGSNKAVHVLHRNLGIGKAYLRESKYLIFPGSRNHRPLSVVLVH